MRLELSISEGTPEVIYEGSLVDEMETAFYAYVGAVGGRYESKCVRWWTTYGRNSVEDGLEPLLSLLNGSELHSWKVWQTPVGS